MKKVVLFFSFPVLALACGALWHWFHPSGLWSHQPKVPTDGFPRVTWAEAAPRVKSNEWLLIDARTEEEYKVAHIPGALSLPSGSFPEMITFSLEGQSREKTAVIYCDTTECDRSVELARRLRAEVNWADVRILEGGMLAWRRSQP